RPPKVKAFGDFVFARLYELEARNEPIPSVVAQEIHLLVGSTFAISIRYPSLAWDTTLLTSAGPQDPVRVERGGIDLTDLQREVVDFRQRVPPGDPLAIFGLEVAAVVLDHVIDSVFTCLDGLRGAAELTELSVLNKNNWLWKRHEWTRLDTSIIGLRRLLGKVRWAFMPDDEIVEFASGP